MKKQIHIIIFLIICVSPAYSQTLSVGLKTAYFIPSNDVFNNIYGKGIMFGGDIMLDISHRYTVWLGGNYFSKQGGLTITDEKTQLRILPIDLGFRYKFTNRRIIPYLGIVVSTNAVRESNEIGTVTKSKMGYSAELGILIKMISRYMCDLNLSYNYCKVSFPGSSVNIGGIKISTGLRFNFGKLPEKPKDIPKPWYDI